MVIQRLVPVREIYADFAGFVYVAVGNAEGRRGCIGCTSCRWRRGVWRPVSRDLIICEKYCACPARLFFGCGSCSLTFEIVWFNSSFEWNPYRSWMTSTWSKRQRSASSWATQEGRAQSRVSAPVVSAAMTRNCWVNRASYFLFPGHGPDATALLRHSRSVDLPGALPLPYGGRSFTTFTTFTTFT